MSRRRFLLLLVAVCAAAYAGRAAYVLVEVRHQEIGTLANTTGVRRSLDEVWYVSAAEHVADGDGVKVSFNGEPAVDDAQHPPLAAVAFVPAALLDAGELAMRFTSLLAGVGAVAAIGLLGREVASDRAGIVAAALAAVYPNLWVNDGLLMSESFAALLSCLAVLFAYRLARRRSYVDAICLGGTCGLAALTRSELVLLLPLLVAPALVRDAARWWRPVLAATAVAAVVVAPWTLYNLGRFDEPVLLSTADGDVLTGANCDETYSGPLLGFHDGFCTLADDVDDASDDPSVDNLAKRELALDYVGDHLDRLPVVVAARVGRLWGLFRPFQMARMTESEGRPAAVSNLGWATLWPLLAAGAAGVSQLRRAGPPIWPLVAPVVLVTLNAAVFFGLVRHRIAAEPSIVVLAAVGIVAVFDRRAVRARV